MKRFYTRLRLPFLAIFLMIFSIRSANAQCILQGGIADPGCGGSTQVSNVGGMQEYNAASTNGADYTVSISSGSSPGCGSYTAIPASFTATSSTTTVDVLAGGLCCWSAGGTSAVLTYTMISYTNTTGSGNICQGDVRGVTVSPTPLTAGTWSVINGTGTGTISGTTFTAVSPGTVTIRYTKGGCNSDVGITIAAAPSTATITGGNQSVCGLSIAALSGNTPTSGTGTWTQLSGPGTTTFGSTNSGSSSATVTAYGTYTYQWSISTSGTCTASTATVNVTYNQNPTVATVGATQNVCGTLTTASLGGNTPAVGTGTWTQTSGPGTTSFSAVNSGSSTATASVIGTYVYRWTIANGSCPSSSASVTVNYYATPSVATAGGTQNICSSLSSASLGGNSPTVGTGVWTQTSGPGTTTFTSSAGSPNATATASVAGTYVYTWTISNGTCTPSTASVTVNFYATPPIAVAIPSTLNACGSLTSPPLTGNNASPGIGTWTQSAGPGTVSFSNANSESSTATVSVPGTYVFTWTITNGTCPSSNASVTVNYIAAPTTAIAGPDQDTCALISSSLGGNSPTIGTGTWSQVSGPGVTFFNSVNSGSSTAAVSTQGTYVFAWTIANGGCTSADSLTVNYYSNPTIATVGGTQNVCGTLTSGGLGGNVAVIGTGVWSQLTGPGTTIFSNPGDNNATATASVTGSYTYAWTISNGTCTPTTANVNVNFIATPTGGSIANTAFCSAIGSGNVSVTGVSNANQYTWALPAGLSGSSTTSSINVGGTLGGTYTVTVTPLDVIFGVTCTGTPITGTVEILSQPVIDSVHAGTVSCFGGGNDTLVVYGHTSNGTLFYSIDGGGTYPNSTGIFPNLTANSYYVLVRDDSSCATSYASNPVVVTQPPNIFVNVASFGDVRCNGDSTGFINISASGGTPALTYAWNNGAISQNISDLAAGTYSLSVTDANGCQVVISQVISEPTALTATASGTNISCHGLNDGTATVVAGGGVTPYDYRWNNGFITPSISNLGGALYSVTVTDNNGCVAVSSYTVVDPPLLSVSLATSNVLCNGGNNGSITATATGGTGAYTYVWSPSVSITATVTNANPGTYILTVSDVNGCSAVDSTIVTQPLSGLAVSSIITPVGCTGDAHGAIQLLPSGGVGGYTYLWSPGGQTTQIISGLSAGPYSATVTDGNGCQVIVFDTLVDPAPIVSGIVGNSAICAGAGGGSATLTVSGGVPAYTFLWSNFEITQNISNLNGGLYRVVITDAYGCEHRDSVIITQPLPLAATFATTNVTCNGASNGTITVTVTGGTGAYSYAWTPNVSTTNSAVNLGPGTYVVTVTDANGCTLVDSATITQPAAALAITATVTDMTCNNANNGSISTQTSGGSGSYTYAWTGSILTTPSLSGLSAGTYTVTVTDANGCTASASGTITNPAPITSTVTGTNVTCAGAADGTAMVATVSGGTGGYTYLWTTFATTQSISGLSGGTIRVIITDANGCQHRDSIILTEPQPLVVTLSSTNVSCSGGNNGTITASVTGGTGAYTYAWTGSASTGPTVANATPGVYTVTVTDVNNCTATATTTVSQPQVLTASVNTTNVTCYGDSNGTINLSVSGGSGTYTYTWSPNVSTGPSVTNAAQGTYLFTVTDGNGCSTQGSAVITGPASPIVVTNIIHNISCYGGHDGSILVLASGGTGAFTYLWADSQVVQYVTGLSMASPFSSTTLFTVTITDANGCSVVVVDTLRVPSAITSSIVGTDVSCAGARDGSATLTVGGGKPPYQYLWSNVATTQNLMNIPGAAYTVVITDSNGCRHTDTVTIHEPLPLVVTLSTTNVNCFGAANGSITATVTGGTTAYTYAWTGSSSTGSTVTNAGPGTYTVTVTDAHGCTQTATTTISQPASAVNLAIAVTDMTCNNANDGSISTQVSGGSGSYTYAWTGSPALTPSISNLIAGSYSVTVTDANGCTASASGTITNPAAITSTVTGTNVTCAGAANGTATVATIAGGTPAYTYLWNSFAATQSVSGLSGGIARVIITDAHGCTHRDSIIITEPQPLTATITSTNVGCTGTNGTVTVSVSGGTGAYSYTWSPNVGSGSSVSGPAGTYYVTVTDANGCQLIDSATISAPASTLAITATVVDMTCHDANNGSISTQTSGGSGSYTYAWTGSILTTPSLSNLSAGTYTVTVTDAGGCTATATGTITNPADITSSTTHTDVTCAGAHNGSAQLTVTGGQTPYTFLWSNFAGTQSVDSLSGGLYRVIITDAHGCQHRDSAFINEPLPINPALNVTQITCNNINDGSITVAATGGTGGYTYQWGPPGNQTSAGISNLAAGTYAVTVTDANGCSATASATIVNPSPLSVASVVINPQCNGSNNGTVTLIVNGGTQAYSYNWSGALAGSGQSAVNVAPGNYYVTVTDAHGCTATDSAFVIAPAPIFVSGITTNVSCNGSRDGSVIATVYGGAVPYSYQWHYDSLTGLAGPITKDWLQLSGGDYYLAITDANGCAASYHAVIKEADSLKLSLSKTDVTCFGANNGTVLASAIGGTTPYHYLWNNFVTDSNQTGLPAGNYGVVVTDSNGCQQTKTINISQPLPITVSVTATNPACSGSSTGSISLSVSGGNGTYSYNWSTTPAQTTNPATGLAAGTYYVTVTDGNSCTHIDSATLTAPQALVVNTAVSNPTCSDGDNGFISLDVRQGTAPYTYNWNTTPAQSGNVASNLVAGTYIATITDAGGCQLFDTAIVVAPQPITISIGTLGNTTCINSTDGYAVINVTGGLAPYTYQLGTVIQTSDTFRNLTTGTYALTVRDANGCLAIIAWTINTSGNFSVDLTVDHDVILAGETIQLTATPTSDTTVTSYVWNVLDSLDFTSCGDPNNCPTPTAMPTSSHLYIVEAINAKGCIATDTVHVTVSREETAFMPTAFTPNGDGNNDRFEFDILGAKVVDVQIWNRWGEKVFSDPAQANGITGNHGWDGTFRGKLVEFDTYTYQFVITYLDGHQKTIAGTLTVMR